MKKTLLIFIGIIFCSWSFGQRITQLTEATSADENSLLMVRDGSTGNVLKKITKGNLLQDYPLASVDSVMSASTSYYVYEGGDTLTPGIPASGRSVLFDLTPRKYLTDTLLITAALDTLELTAAGQYIRTANATKCAICIPANASVAFPIGTTIYFWNEGAGTLKFRPAAGVTINSELDSTEVANAHAPAYLIKRATNKWELGGSILN